MRKIAFICFLLSLAFNHLILAQSSTDNRKGEDNYLHIKNEAYELHKPRTTSKAFLLLFGGYPQDAEDIKREFEILESALEQKIAVIFSNYNQKLWFEKGELNELAGQIEQILQKHQLLNVPLTISGFSSGGNVALLLSNYLTSSNSFNFSPKNLFVIDSPIDLSALYTSSEKNIERNFSQTSVAESEWLIATLGSRFGKPENNLDEYEVYSVYTHQSKHSSNLKALKETRLRFYAEPDINWWKENRQADYDQTNAFYLEALYHTLREKGFRHLEYITTENRGFRANGQRHPHSWAIVEIQKLLAWLLED